MKTQWKKSRLLQSTRIVEWCTEACGTTSISAACPNAIQPTSLPAAIRYRPRRLQLSARTSQLRVPIATQTRACMHCCIAPSSDRLKRWLYAVRGSVDAADLSLHQVQHFTRFEMKAQNTDEISNRNDIFGTFAEFPK